MSAQTLSTEERPASPIITARSNTRLKGKPEVIIPARPPQPGERWNKSDVEHL